MCTADSRLAHLSLTGAVCHYQNHRGAAQRGAGNALRDQGGSCPEWQTGRTAQGGIPFGRQDIPHRPRMAFFTCSGHHHPDIGRLRDAILPGRREPKFLPGGRLFSLWRCPRMAFHQGGLWLSRACGGMDQAANTAGGRQGDKWPGIAGLDGRLREWRQRGARYPQVVVRPGGPDRRRQPAAGRGVDRDGCANGHGRRRDRAGIYHSFRRQGEAGTKHAYPFHQTDIGHADALVHLTGQCVYILFATH